MTCETETTALAAKIHAECDSCFDRNDIHEALELLGQMAAQHADQSRSQAALRHQHCPCLGGQCADGAGGRHILGQIKVVHAPLRCCRGHR